MFFIEKTVEELDEKKREQVLFFLVGSLNFLAVFLFRLVFDEKHVCVYAQKPAHAQKGGASGIKLPLYSAVVRVVRHRV